MALPVITQQPVDAVGWARRIGADFSITATSDNGALSYQWYFADGDVLIVGAIGADLNFTPFHSQTGKGVYCIATNLDGGTQSNTAFLTQVVDPDSGLVNAALSEYRTSPWVATQGGGSWRVSTAYNHYIQRGVFGGGTSDGLSQYDQLSPVKQGFDLLVMSWSLRAFADDDDANSYYQFFEADGTTAIGAQIKFNSAPPINTDATLYAEALILAASIPVNAAFVRIRTEHDRNTGTSNNCSIGFCAVVIDPDNFESMDGLRSIDPRWNRVYALLDMIGTNGDTTVANLGHDPSTWNFQGTAQLSNADSLFGSATVARFNGDGGLVSTDTSWWPGTNQGSNLSSINKGCTIEIWFKPDVGTLGAIHGLLYVGSTTSNTNRVQSTIHSTGTIRLFHDNGGSSQTIVETANTINEDEWNFVRITYANPAQLQLNDGEPVSFRMIGSNLSALMPLGNGLRLGEARSGSQVYFNGYMGPVRFTNTYRHPRKIPIPDRTFPVLSVDELYDDLVVSHIIGDSPNGQTTIDDNKGVNWVGTNAAYTSAVQHFGGNTLQITNGYLETSDLPDFNLGSLNNGHLNIAMWVNWDGVSLTPLFWHGLPGTNFGRFQIRIDADGTVQVYGSKATGGTVVFNYNTAVALPAAGWHYLEFTLSGRKVWMTANGGFMGDPLQMTGSQEMDYSASAVTRIGYSQASATGQNTTAEFMDVRVTYTPHDDSTAARPMEAGQASSGPPLTYMSTQSALPTDGPVINTQPQSQTVEDQSMAVFTVAATSSGGPLTYQWFFDGAIPLPGENADTLSVLADWDTTQGEIYYVVVSDLNGSTQSDNAVLTVSKIPLVYTVQPASQNILDLSPVTFHAEVTGRPPFTYQWFDDVTGLLAGETGQDLTFTVDWNTDNGVGYNRVTNDYYQDVGHPSAVAVLTVDEIPLVIVTQPVSQLVVDEQPATFSIDVSGRDVTYQWTEDTVDMPGEVADEVTVTADYFSQPVNYQCDIEDTYGNTQQSSIAVLTVDKIPVSWVGPDDLEVIEWDPASFTAIPTAKTPIATEWYENGSPTGDFDPTFDIPQAPPSADGNEYLMELTDGYGDVSNSPTAILTVIPRPIEETIDVRVLDPDGIWVSIVGPPGEDGDPRDLINDAIVSYDFTWSSEKISLEQSRYVLWDQLPHALYGPQQSDVDTTLALTENNVLRWDIAAGKFIPDYATFWRGQWVIDDIYYKGDQVEDQGWLMTCNAVDGTYERAGPQIHGGETFIFGDSPAWDTEQATGLVLMTMQVEMTPNLCQQFRIWPATTGPNVSHYVEVIIRRGGAGAIPVSRSYFNPVLLADQWNVLQFADAPLVDGTIVDVNFYVVDASTETGLGPFDWIYEGTSQTNGPSSGGWNVNNQRTILRINKTDADSIDQETVLLGSTPGSSVEFAVEGAIENAQQYFALSDPVDMVDYVEWTVSLTDASGTIQVNDRCLTVGIIPTAQATDYVQIPNYFPSGNPEWGTCTTTLTIDGVLQAEPDTTGYGIDIGAAPGVISEFWDYNNYSDVSQAPSPSARDVDYLKKQSGSYGAPETLQTTDAMWTAVNTTTLPDNTAYFIRAIVVGRREDSFDYCKFTMDGVTWNDSGTAGDDVGKVVASSSANGLDCRVSTAGADVSLDVKGKGGQTWNWTVYYFTEEIT